MTAKDEFDSSKINEKELDKYRENYSDTNLLQKIHKYGAKIGIELLYKALELWFVMQKPEVSKKDKALIMGALGYLISPLDFIPDLTPALGYSDDLVAVVFAYVHLQGYIDSDVKQKAKALLLKFFDKEAVKKL